ncbi:MAG: type II toxin-antitoxin system HicA family toxin [Candidatus Aminicenantes bacterium]|nr:type II toxin-antitoxin system HicA family toxin [Candidatus Aminicenantes bacterium]
MSRRDKALRRFLSRPADLRFDEMSRLLKDLGYEEIKSGKTSGSRVAYFNKLSGHIIRLHKPHPGNIMKRYQMELIEDALRAKGSIK